MPVPRSRVATDRKWSRFSKIASACPRFAIAIRRLPSASIAFLSVTNEFVARSPRLRASSNYWAGARAAQDRQTEQAGEVFHCGMISGARVVYCVIDHVENPGL